MDQASLHKKISKLTILLFLWNPVTLWLLTKNLLLSLITVLSILIVFIFVDNHRSIRLKIWLFNIVMICSILYHSELVFRVIYPEKDVPNLYEIRKGYYFNKPHLNERFNNQEFNTTYRTNCQGYRIDAESNAYDELHYCDWLFIGDSYTQGAQVNYDKLFSSLIYKDFCDKVIINAGISGAGICDELNYYKDEGYKLGASKVFLQIGVFNDFFNVFEREASIQDYLIDYSSLYRFCISALSTDPGLKLGRWVEPFSHSRQGNIDNNILFRESSEKKKKDLLNFEEYIKQFNKIVNDNGAELVVLLIPSKEQVSDELLSDVMNAYNIKHEELDMNYPSTFMRDIAAKHNFKLIDLYEDFRRSDKFPFFYLDEHMNEIGHEIIAQRIRSEYCELMPSYIYLSKNNLNDRYPTIYNQGQEILHQNCINGRYNIVLNNSSFDEYKSIVTSTAELIHPTLSNNKRYLLYTEGYQDTGETEVILHDLQTGESSIITSGDKAYGAIAQFNKAGNKVVYASWTPDQQHPDIAIYDIATGLNIQLCLNNAECWRPVFWRNDKEILYIYQNENSGYFEVNSYSLESTEIRNIITRPYDIWDIAVSPTEKYIAYAGKTDGNWNIYIYEVETGSDYQLTYGLGDEWDPAFGSTESELWFAGTAGINNGIYYLTINDSFTNNHN